MTEKNAFAKFMDSLVEKKKSENDDVLNMLPKPDTQEIGDGILIWRWKISMGVVESVLATRNNNQTNLEKDSYVVSVQLPDSENHAYSLFDETAKELGAALLSAWNWQNIWKLHAGDFLLEVLSKEPEPKLDEEVAKPEAFIPNDKEIVEAEKEESHA